MGKTAIVDIDNTLWQFCDPLYDRLKKINPEIPVPAYWTEWDFFEPFCSKETFLEVINDIHYHQDHDGHVPYPEARNFLAALKQNGYHITIASHRSAAFTIQTERWLKKHGLLYDDIHLSYHKTQLINMFTSVVVDDAPQVLEKAIENGAFATGLLFPWNKAYSDNGFRLCSNLNDILEAILKQ
jgi:hypothetical protein